MASTLTNLLYHLVFSTKERENLITPKWEPELYAYIGGIIRGEKGVLLNIGGMPDHIHLSVRFSPTVSVSEMLQRIKGNSSKWVNEEKKLPAHFSWQQGYGAFSVSESQIDKVAAYIENQKAHHKKVGFKEEFIGFLKNHNVSYDEKYVWG